MAGGDDGWPDGSDGEMSNAFIASVQLLTVMQYSGLRCNGHVSANIGLALSDDTK